MAKQDSEQQAFLNAAYLSAGDLLRAGVSREQVEQRLVRMGFSSADASETVEDILQLHRQHSIVHPGESATENACASASSEIVANHGKILQLPDIVNPPTASRGAKGTASQPRRPAWIVLALLAGCFSANLAGFLVHFLVVLVSGDPHGAVLPTTLLGGFSLALGGYIAGRLRGQSELTLAISLALVDAEVKIVGLVMLQSSSLLPEALHGIASDISPAVYIVDLIVTVPAYALGGLLAWAQRRYIERRTVPHTVGRSVRIGLRVVGVSMWLAGWPMFLGGLLVIYVNMSSNPHATVVGNFVFSAISGIGAMCVAVSRKWNAASAPPLIGLPVIALFRAFEDDVREFDSNLPFTLGMDPRNRSLENALLRAADTYGCVGAIGDPRESLATPGAARCYFEADDNVHWRERALAYIDGCWAILMVLGSGAGVRWEYSQVAARRALTRVVLVVPPGKRDKNWQTFREDILSQGITGLPDALPADVALVRFDEEGRCRFYTASKLNAATYTSQLKRALAEMIAGQFAPGESRRFTLFGRRWHRGLGVGILLSTVAGLFSICYIRDNPVDILQASVCSIGIVAAVFIVGFALGFLRGCPKRLVVHKLFNS